MSAAVHGRAGAFPGLTPLAASLLSPLGLTADFWRSSPLGKELSRELSKLSQEDINKLLAGAARVSCLLRLGGLRVFAWGATHVLSCCTNVS